MIAAGCLVSRSNLTQEPNELHVFRFLDYSYSFSIELESLLWNIWLINMHLELTDCCLMTPSRHRLCRYSLVDLKDYQRRQHGYCAEFEYHLNGFSLTCKIQLINQFFWFLINFTSVRMNLLLLFRRPKTTFSLNKYANTKKQLLYTAILANYISARVWAHV